MYVIATFEQSIFLEMALSALEETGIAPEQILAVTLRKRREPRQLMDTIQRADGMSMLDLSSVLGTVFMLLGAIYGYVLKWGPILWGIIGAVFGLLAGFAVKYFMVKGKRDPHLFHARKIASEAVLIVACEESKCETVERLLWENTALGLSKLEMKPQAKNG